VTLRGTPHRNSQDRDTRGQHYSNLTHSLVVWLGLRVGEDLALVYIHQINQLNSYTDFNVTATSTTSTVLNVINIT